MSAYAGSIRKIIRCHSLYCENDRRRLAGIELIEIASDQWPHISHNRLIRTKIGRLETDEPEARGHLIGKVDVCCQCGPVVLQRYRIGKPVTEYHCGAWTSHADTRIESGRLLD